MKKLNDADVLRLMREEWNAKVKVLSENVDLAFKSKVDGKESTIVDSGLKLRHKKSQLLYTVISVSPNEAELCAYNPPGVDSQDQQPEAVEFLVDRGTLEKEYEID
jgi:hypothetical protein